jgi:hypothetical protein
MILCVSGGASPSVQIALVVPRLLIAFCDCKQEAAFLTGTKKAGAEGPIILPARPHNGPRSDDRRPSAPAVGSQPLGQLDLLVISRFQDRHWAARIWVPDQIRPANAIPVPQAPPGDSVHHVHISQKQVRPACHHHFCLLTFALLSPNSTSHPATYQSLSGCSRGCGPLRALRSRSETSGRCDACTRPSPS